DGREDIVPATAVEADDILFEGVKNLVHLERRGQCLDEHGRLDRAPLEAKLGLRESEDVVPQCRFVTALELWQIEIRTGAFGERCSRVAPKIDGKVEQR